MSSLSEDLPGTKRKANHRHGYRQLYSQTTQETLVGLYAKRDKITGQPSESVDDIVRRVSQAIALTELKYTITAQEIIDTSLEKALKEPVVVNAFHQFSDHIGNQLFWPNTPCSINADPEVSLQVLKYWAYGKLEGLSEEEIWLKSDEFRKAFDCGDITGLSDHQVEMGRLAAALQGHGCLAACGVAYMGDSLESIQDTAKVEALAAKAAMGMGLNTSTIRPWSSLTSNGAAASGPDRFYEQTISKAVDAVAQGGRRGGALIELRNSDHPDILFFLEKKRLSPQPQLSSVYRELTKELPRLPNESNSEHLSRLMPALEQQFGQQFADYLKRQERLQNTNITVLAMPGFMEAVQKRTFYQSTFNGRPWNGPIYDPRRPVIDPKTKKPKINLLTKEPIYEEYVVDLHRFSGALGAASAFPSELVTKTKDYISVKGYLYAPEVFQRIIDGMKTSGEPGIAFYETVNANNANFHVYALDTCNPCGEQFLPAGPGLDGRHYMGTCNLSSMHAAHPTFWNADGSYNSDAMKTVARVMQHFMDNLTDVSWYPIPAQNMTTRMERRNGGGFAGIAEYLSRLELEFGTNEALHATEQLFFDYTDASVAASIELAEQRGPYPLWEGSRWSDKGLRVRNTCMTNNAPTGTLAQALQTSWGVDPHNGIAFTRTVRSRKVDFVAPGFKDLMVKYGAWPKSEGAQIELMRKIRQNHRSCRGLPEVPEQVQKAFPLRIEVEPEDYIKHLAAVHNGAKAYPEAFNSVSNTCSIPPDMPEHAIAQAVLLAYELGVKDITFYPDGSRLSQPVETIAAQKHQSDDDFVALLNNRHKREISVEETEGVTYKVSVGSPGGGSTLHVCLNHELDRPGQLVEIYARMGKQGAIEAGLFEALGRLSSAFLQYAAQFGETEREKAEELVIHHLVNIQCGYPAFFKFPNSTKPVLIQSPCDGLAKAIQRYRDKFPVGNGTNRASQDFTPGKEGSEKPSDNPGTKSESNPASTQPTQKGTCGTCGGTSWTMIDGCWTCEGCGYSDCG